MRTYSVQITAKGQGRTVRGGAVAKAGESVEMNVNDAKVFVGYGWGTCPEIYGDKAIMTTTPDVIETRNPKPRRRRKNVSTD